MKAAEFIAVATRITASLTFFQRRILLQIVHVRLHHGTHRHVPSFNNAQTWCEPPLVQPQSQSHICVPRTPLHYENKKQGASSNCSTNRSTIPEPLRERHRSVVIMNSSCMTSGSELITTIASSLPSCSRLGSFVLRSVQSRAHCPSCPHRRHVELFTPGAEEGRGRGPSFTLPFFSLCGVFLVLAALASAL